MRVLMMALIMTMALGGTGWAKPALREVPEIDNRLFTIGLADQIRKSCPTISPRIFRALGFLRDLKAQAKSMGYTDAEIDAHVDSDVEKDRLRARAKDYMAARGFEQDETGYCALGRDEIKRDTSIGVLLRTTD